MKNAGLLARLVEMLEDITWNFVWKFLEPRDVSPREPARVMHNFNPTVEVPQFHPVEPVELIDNRNVTGGSTLEVGAIGFVVERNTGYLVKVQWEGLDCPIATHFGVIRSLAQKRGDE